MLASVRDANASGAARRRQRRLRQWLRHERLSVAMALAECTHHSAPRGQKMARAGGGGARDELHGHAPDDAPPHGRILRHVVGHLPAPSLDVPVPQMVDQPVDFLTFFAMLLPAVDEQVIAVPKFIQEVTPQRLRPPEPQQLVEQLVEVPTIVSFSSLQRIMDQTVDIPAPRGRGRRGGLQDFSQDRVQQLLPTLTFQFLVVIFKVSSRARGSLPHLLSLELLMRLVKGFFALVPTEKSAECRAGQCGTCPGTSAHGHRQLMTCLWARTRRLMSCSLSRWSSGRRRSGPGFLSSSAPLPG